MPYARHSSFTVCDEHSFLIHFSFAIRMPFFCSATNRKYGRHFWMHTNKYRERQKAQQRQGKKRLCIHNIWLLMSRREEKMRCIFFVCVCEVSEYRGKKTSQQHLKIVPSKRCCSGNGKAGKTFVTTCAYLLLRSTLCSVLHFLCLPSVYCMRAHRCRTVCCAVACVIRYIIHWKYSFFSILCTINLLFFSFIFFLNMAKIVHRRSFFFFFN